MHSPTHNIGMMCALLFVLLFWLGLAVYVFANVYDEDFTDTGVGCVEDCLEPLANN